MRRTDCLVISSPDDLSKTLVHDRRQMPVGQGGFHVGGLRQFHTRPFPISSGIESFAKSQTLYVYDCGSEPKRNVTRETKALRAACPDARLDILALSHFDRDHICGTPHLLGKHGGFEVDTIMLPFVEMDERVVALARAAASVEQHGGVIDSFFVRMVSDPVGTLAAYGPRRIVLVQGNDYDAPTPEGLEPAPGRDLEDGREVREGISWALGPAYTGRPMRQRREPNAGARGDVEVLVVRDAACFASTPGAGALWKLLPYVRTANPATLAQFRTEAEQKLGWKLGSFAARVSAPGEMKRLATTKRTKLAQAYAAAFHDKNLTSMSLYSGPSDPSAVDALSELQKHPLTKIGWLGTGDARLSEAAEISSFESAYGADLLHASTFVFPHHGSIENTDPTKLVADADIWVAAADPTHDWEHPHWRLRQAIDSIGRTFRHVRAWPTTALHERFIVAPKAADP